jgi:hypothetical protein
MRTEKRARGVPGFFDPACAAQRKDPLRGALRLEVAARIGRRVFVEQREGSLRIPPFDCEIGVAKKANVPRQHGGRGGGGERALRGSRAADGRGCDRGQWFHAGSGPGR